MGQPVSLEAVVVRIVTSPDRVFVPRASPIGGRGEARRCHANVSRWEELHPEDVAVYGWLLIEIPDLGEANLLAHSVVRLSSGDLIDVTPMDGAAEYPFIPHPGDAMEFASMIEGKGISTIVLDTSTIPWSVAAILGTPVLS